MYARSRRSGIALAVVAVSVSVLALPMAAKAFHVMWPQHSAKVANLAADLDDTFKALAVEPQGLEQAAGGSAIRHTTLIAVRSGVAEPAFGQIFASVSAVGRVPSLVQSHSGSARSGSAGQGSTGSSLAAAQSDAPVSAARIKDAETVALALLFSGSANISDKQLDHLTTGSGPAMTQAGALDNCEGRQRCAIAAAPVPGTIWLFLSALLGLIGVGYRRRGQPLAS